MKKRYLYSLLFGIPGLFVAGTLSILAFGGLAGILWLYVFGDSPLPPYVEGLASVLFVLAVLAIWIAFIAAGFIAGKRLENDPVLNRSHVLISAGLTVMFLLLIFLHQWSVGNLGPKSDTAAICSDFCVQHGFSGSGMPPEISGDRMCSCYDSSGNEALRIPMDHLNPDASR